MIRLRGVVAACALLTIGSACSGPDGVDGSSIGAAVSPASSPVGTQSLSAHIATGPPGTAAASAASSVAEKDPLIWRGIWPYTSRRQAEMVQEREDADGPGGTWRHDLEGISYEYRKQFLGWDGLYWWDALSRFNAVLRSEPPEYPHDARGPFTLHLAACDQRGEEFAQFVRCPRAEIRLFRPIHGGEGGIWSVIDSIHYRRGEPSLEQRAVGLVRRFMDARVAGPGSDAERYVTRGAAEAYDGLGPPAFYGFPGVRWSGYRILSMRSLDLDHYRVAVEIDRMRGGRADGSFTEILEIAIRRARTSSVVQGARISGVTRNRFGTGQVHRFVHRFAVTRRAGRSIERFVSPAAAESVARLGDLPPQDSRFDGTAVHWVEPIGSRSFSVEVHYGELIEDFVGTYCEAYRVASTSEGGRRLPLVIASARVCRIP